MGGMLWSLLLIWLGECPRFSVVVQISNIAPTHSLSTVMCSYLWFLYHNREVSYRSILHMTVTKRQMKLYSQRGFDLERWEELVDEARALRREVRSIAGQYDVNWNEKHDEAGGEKVLKVLNDGEEKKRRNDVKSDAEKDEEEEAAGLEKVTK